MRSLQTSLGAIEEQIRRGSVLHARRALLRLPATSLPRSVATAVAHLAWRAGLPERGLRILQPYVRPIGISLPQGSEKERLAYAQCLNRIGAREEALEVLGTLDPARQPETHLYKAFALASEWNYDEVIAMLLPYVKHSALTDYQRLVGQVNLASAYLATGDRRSAVSGLRHVLFQASLRKLDLLQAKALELAACHFIFLRDWESAGKCLSRIKSTVRASGTVDALTIRKWEAILALAKDSGSRIGRLRVEIIRRRAALLRHWETIRDCDRHEAVLCRDPDLFLRVYFGTGYEGFRASLIREWPEIAIPDSYLWRSHPGQSVRWTFDLRSGRVDGGKAGMSVGNVPHRLLGILLRDLYRPQRPLEIFRRLYPDQVYEPYSSRMRIYEAVKRLRGWLKGNHAPLHVEETDGFYRIEFLWSCAIRLPAAFEEDPRFQHQLRKLREKTSHGPFSITDAVAHLALPRRSVQRLLEKGFKRGDLERFGGGNLVFYRFRSIPNENFSEKIP